ncbi:uncharacterized protein LOC107879422 [Capsicum annuum]|uniref:uncharacterized protein LOC107879422 n=1 Tax=Capsicum annuum TaxID=4072 RepID=UPI001FB14AF0|nr:uncharacterized protein LOC107879422 [Capsicum annuum]
MVRGTAEHGYSYLLGFSYMIDALNVGTTYSIMVNKVTENHIYPITFCVVDKENDASWTFFFEKLKSIVVDGSDLCFISDRNKSIANGIAKAYNHAHHGYCMRHLGKNLWVNHHCGEHLYLFYNAAKAYSPEKFSDHFVEFKNYCPEAAFFLKHELGFEKWSRAYFPADRFDVMTTTIAESVNAMLIDEREYPVASIFNSIAKRFGKIFRERRAYVLKCKNNKFVPAAEKILRDNMSKGDSFYVENISGDERRYTVFRSGYTAKVDLLERSCSCRKFDLVKIPYDHAMAVL